MQNNLFPASTDWRPPKISELPELEGPIAFDVETKDTWLNEKGPGYVKKNGTFGHIIGYCLSDSNHDMYLPVRHADAVDNLPIDEVLAYVRRQCAKPGPKIMANATYDLGWAETDDIHFKPEEIHDVQIQAALLDEHRRSYALDALGKDYLDVGKDYTLLEEVMSQHGIKKTEIMKNIWKLPGRFTGSYGEQDGNLTLKLYLHFKDMIKMQELDEVYNMERALLPILLDMKKRGIRLDTARAEQTREEFVAKEKKAHSLIKEITGNWLDVYSNKAVGHAFDGLSIPYEVGPTGIPKIDIDVLQSIEHPVAQAVRDARRFQKAKQTFIDNYLLDREVDGRIHAQFNQLRSDQGGTVSGRFSCSGPNLQNIPVKDPEIGKAVRSCFLPEEGEKWMAADYANQEPRITVHWAHTVNMPGAAEVVERYKTDPDISYHKIVQEFMGEYVPEHLDPYKACKQMNLAIAYGMGGGALCEALGLPTKWMIPPDKNDTGQWKDCEEDDTNAIKLAGDEGKALLDIYHEKVPYIRKLSNLCSNRAKKRGWIKTILGRRCRFTGQYPGYHKALNRLVQGSAADQTKVAMIEMHKAGHTMLLTMHDELGMSIKDDDEARQIKEIMEGAIEMSVPFKCDVDIGPSWGEADEIRLD